MSTFKKWRPIPLWSYWSSARNLSNVRKCQTFHACHNLHRSSLYRKSSRDDRVFSDLCTKVVHRCHRRKSPFFRVDIPHKTYYLLFCNPCRRLCSSHWILSVSEIFVNFIVIVSKSLSIKNYALEYEILKKKKKIVQYTRCKKNRCATHIKDVKGRVWWVLTKKSIFFIFLNIPHNMSDWFSQNQETRIFFPV